MDEQTRVVRRSRKTAPDKATAAAYDAAWHVEAPAGPAWTARPWVHPTARAAEGKAARKRVPRVSHAAFEPRPDRDPIAILAAQEEDRLPDLVPLRHERMAESAFAYYRGTPAVMAFDLAGTPRTEIVVQASGDAHISNFGLFASPERTLVFDANDFDETLPGPWEWDVKRLAASVVIAGRANGFSPARTREATMGAVRGYRLWMARYASMRLLDVWYLSISDVDIREEAEATGLLGGRAVTARRGRLEAIFSKARRRDGMRAFESLTAVVDGRRVILEDPPVITHVQTEGQEAALERVFTDYRATMPENRRDFLERYRFVDFARKVVGVGSVGTRCYIIVLQGRDENDPLILQVKEATASVMEPYLPASVHASHGQRVVVGQQLMQATPDIFLGWTQGPAGRAYYLRQLWDMKGSVDTTTLAPPGLTYYGALCGRSLARAHARTGDAVAIAAYLGTGDTFDGAIADFSEACADVNARDHAAYVAAIEAGRVSLPAG
ncbi:MAG TPA: DUF2252 domain-containing protein [Candidatus Nanopelagicales bacterium]|nr:DUF2252 domain-containing protein [Candidatus Nanopelagicales bacterium]